MASASRMAQLDGLRGVAIALVLINHYLNGAVYLPRGWWFDHLRAPLRLAWTGVDLFFVLSGFLIGGILLDARRSTNYFGVFYRRRFFRILPLYWVCLIVAAILSALPIHVYMDKLLGGPKEACPWWSYLLFLQNIWLPFRQYGGPLAVAVTWSLAVEEQFYLTLPILVRFLRPERLVPVLVSGIAFAPLWRISSYYISHNQSVYWYVMMPGRADALLLGVLCAVAVRNDRWRSWLVEQRQTFVRIAFPILTAGTIALTHWGAGVNDFLMVSIGCTWMAGFYATTLLYAILWGESGPSVVLRWGWLRSLGLIAYGTYLFHETILGIFFGIFRGRMPVAQSWTENMLVVAALVVTLVLCRLSWAVFEKPLIRIGHEVEYAYEAKSVGASMVEAA